MWSRYWGAFQLLRMGRHPKQTGCVSTGCSGLAALLVLNWLFSDDDKEKQPESVPPDKAEIPRKTAETPVFRQIPAEIPAMPAAVPRPPVPRVVVLPPAVPAAPKKPAPVPAPAAVKPVPVRPSPVNSAPVQPAAPVAKPASPVSPQLARKRIISRADMATIFDAGKRCQSRLSAVAALKRLGFGKTAAYSATAPDGRFSAWLVFASDGIIYWTDGHGINPAIL